MSDPQKKPVPNPDPKIIIDSEFAGYLPAKTPDEYAQLQQNIQADGCRDALVVEKQTRILLDGHSRYEICTRLGLPYTIVEIELADRTAALMWIVANQVGRRNLNSFQRAELALKLEPLIALKGKKHQREGLSNLTNPVNTRREVARIAAVSEGTISNVKRIMAAPPEYAEMARSGKASINEVLHKYLSPPKAGRLPRRQLLTRSGIEAQKLMSQFERAKGRRNGVGIIHIESCEVPTEPAVPPTPTVESEPLCDVPGCESPAFRTINWCAVHVESNDIDTNNPRDWLGAFKRHVAALKQLLQQIPGEALNDANRALERLNQHGIKLQTSWTMAELNKASNQKPNWPDAAFSCKQTSN
jgi:hypothetical protein